MENKALYLRYANEGDMKDYFKWRNEKLTRMASFNKDKIKWRDHVKWFRHSLTDPNKNLFVLIDEKTNKIGQVRFDKKKTAAEIDVSIAPEYRGQGYGSIIIQLASREYLNNNKIRHIIAKIKSENTYSLVSFQKAGFMLYKDFGNYKEFRRKNESKN
jgi:UDP-2,4-diacetamido-2,4,6-trideoxy-beta-L-altropyranose hydrolase